MSNKYIFYLQSYSPTFLSKSKAISLLLLLFFISLSHLSYSQFDRTNNQAGDPEPCATDIIHQRKLAQDPEYRANYEKMNKDLRDYIQNNSNQRREGDLIIIPLVVHIMHTGGAVGSIYNPTDASINEMVAYVNQMYRNQAPFNTAGGVDVEVQFELAQRTENCTATNGINRVDASVVAGYNANGIATQVGNPGVPEIQIKDLSRWSNTDYYNIWIVNRLNGADGTVGSFTAGYAYFPGAGADVDGTVMLATQINPGEITLPHEIGHALRLSHTFQGSTGVGVCPPNADCTTQGDFVCDTAPHDVDHFQCTTNVCDADLTVLENTMSYSGCQDKFTLGQRTRMRIALETQRPGLISSLGSVPPPASLPALACIPTAGTPSFAGMERIRFNTIDVTSNAADDEGSYVDRSCTQGTTVLAGSTHELRVNSFFTNSHKVRAYIDYNNNGDFTDAGEEVLVSNSGIEHIANVVIPTTGVPFNQPLRMRVVGDFVGNADPNSCTVDQGQAEDFSVIIETNLPCDITAITAGAQTVCIPATNEYTQEVTVTFANEPSTGNLVVNGQAFPLTASPQTVTLVGLNSDGASVDVTATFSANGTCPFTETGLFTAPSNCSGPNINATALKFDGINDYVDISNPFTAFTNAITVEWWVKVTGNLPVGTGFGQSRLNLDNMSSNVWLMHENTVGNNFGFYVNDGGTWRTAFASYTQNVWTHYAGVSDASGTKIYKNGVLISTTAGISSSIISNPTAHINIGKDVRYPSGRFGSMEMDEIRIWNIARTQCEIVANMNNELLGNEAGLVGYYNFNQGIAEGNNPTVTTLNDITPNNRNGNLNNFALTGNNSNWIDGTSNGVSGTTPTPEPEINVQGNFTSILDGDITPSITDNTDFGNVAISRTITYTIQNIGAGDLLVSSIDITGSNALEFVVSNITLPITVSGNSTTTFDVTFTPLGTGIRIATLTINNNDCDEDIYNFVIQGITQPCDITAITAGAQTVCVPATNEYTQQVTVTFANEPSTGNLVVNGQAFPLTASPQTVTLVGLNSDGASVDVTATFSANGTCPFTETGLFTAPTSCAPAITLGAITPNTYCAGETISIPFTTGGTFNAGNTFTAQLSSAGGTFIPAIATQTGTSPILLTIPLTAVTGAGYKVRVFSSSPSLISSESPTFTINALPLNRTIIANPNTINVGLSSNIDVANSQIGVNYQLQNVTAGNINVGTPVAGTGGLISIPTGNLASTTDFRVVAISTATCERIFNTTTVNVVVPCTISAITAGATGACDVGTNLYTKEVVITYVVPPLTGTLVVNGQNFPITTSPQTVILTGLTADGNPVSITASFSADAACTFTQNNAFTAPTPCNIPTINLGVITPTDYCPNTIISVPFTFSGAFGAANTFTAQLSDETGSFTTPLVINSAASPISLLIPALATASTNYRVRVIGSDPFATSAEFGITIFAFPIDIIINANPTIIALGASSNIEIPSSQLGTNYQLQDVTAGNINVGLPFAGTGGILSINTGSLTSTTDFRVVATNAVTTCERILNTVTVTINAPEINVVSNATSVLNGDNTPSLTDNTDFGSILTCTGSIQKIFTIQNTGTLDLVITAISSTGTDFTFTPPIFPLTITAGNSEDIVIDFDPSVNGNQTQTLTILSNDNDEANYIFDIKGRGEIDTQNPIITAPVAVNANTDAGICTASGVALGTPTTSDDCGSVTVTNSLVVGFVFPIGNTNVVWTATDAVGNSASAIQIVTVTDNENPTVVAPADVNVSCPADVVLGIPTTNDNCGINATRNDAPAIFPNGITTVIWTVEDFEGNTGTASQTVTVSDTQNPTVSTPIDISVGCPQNVVLVPPTTSDNCTGETLINDAPITFPQGTTTVTWTVTDAVGNTATSTNTVTVNDITNPTITAPSNLILNCTETVVLGIPTTNDDCGVASVTNNAPIAPATYPLGTTTVTWTVTDNSGNTATATQTVTISDIENPTITAPLSVVVPTDAAICTAAGVDLGTPTTADNCGVASITNDAPTIFPIGTTDVTWTVTDNAGNIATATQPVTILDRINPTMVNPIPVNLLTDINACTATNNLTPPITSDNCTIADVVSNAPTDFPIGNTTVTWTATDGAGNTVIKTQIVNVTRDPASVRVTISSPDTVICTNETTIFEATGATSYIFYRNGVQVSTNATYEPPVGTLQHNDQIWVIGQTNDCPDTTRKMTVLVNALPVVDLGVDKFKCRTDTTFFAAPENSDYIYDWKMLDVDGNPISVGNGNDTLFVSDTGTYFINITNTVTSCTGTSNRVRVLNYDDDVVVSLGEDKTICDPADLPYRLVGSDLSHLAGTTYEWYVAGENTIIGTDSVLDVTAENTYSVVAQDPRGCRISDTIRINFTPTPDFVITGHENPNCGTFDTLTIERTNIRNMTIEWFGNGIVSTSADQKTIVVNVSGIYTATITDNNTDANCTYSQSVEVFVRPNIDLGLSVTDDVLRLCEGDSLVLDAFRPEHNNNFNYQWRIIENNQTVSTNSKIAINYEMVNNYTSNRFEVKVTDPNLTGGGSCSITDTVFVRFDRKTGVEIDSSFIKTLCLGQTQTLTATGADSYEWSNGATTSTIEVTPIEAGYYTFIVNGTFSSPNLCGASADTIKFRVVNVPELSVPETLVICENDSVEVDAFLPSHQPRYIYEWTNETTGEIIDTLALHVFKQDSANITYQPQTFKVGVYDTLGGGRCGIESLITVTFSRSATPTILASDTLVCVGEEITLTAEGATNFRWNTGETTPSITVSSDSAGVFRYTALGSYGTGENVCDSLGTSILVQFKGVPTININKADTVSICVGDSLQFIASGGASYAWSHTPTETGDTVVVYPTDTTMYVVTGFDTLGCSSTDTVVVLAQPQIDLGADQQLCKGDTTIIGAPRPFGATYLWSTGATTDSITVTFGGNYFVEVNINECSYTDTVNIDYINPPKLAAIDTVLCFEDAESRLIFHELGVKIKNYDSTARYRYQWIDEAGEIVGTDSLLSTKFGGNYLVRVTAEYETSCNAMTTLVIRASCEPEVYIPTAFTPNNDDFNDEWEIFGRYYSNLRVRIIDRWGMIMHESYTESSSDEIELWNGQYKGKQVPAGVYYYEITYNSPTDNSQTIKQTGTVTVIY